jgi:putative intracellular protease/amidase
MDIAIPLFDRFTALDCVGPYEVLCRLPDARVVFVAAKAGAVQADTRMLTLLAETSLADLPEPDVVCVPGGFGTRALLGDEEMLGWLRHAHATSTWTTSVCTGSLLLAAAGILDGLEATTHWASTELLGELGATPVQQRVVEQGKVMTAAGVSAGIDMALTLAARIAGDTYAKGIQLSIEYDPEPPFDTGSPAKAGPELVAAVRRVEDSQG